MQDKQAPAPVPKAAAPAGAPPAVNPTVTAAPKDREHGSAASAVPVGRPAVQQTLIANPHGVIAFPPDSAMSAGSAPAWSTGAGMVSPMVQQMMANQRLVASRSALTSAYQQAQASQAARLVAASAVVSAAMNVTQAPAVSQGPGGQPMHLMQSTGGPQAAEENPLTQSNWLNSFGVN
mmetsp:Transcript_6390/g.10089  ORF Transcript_6390/g.10089 Transcript_6390/m.10089 type:complete len:178 (+) Transcript_6390:1813-2346(+)